MLSQDRRKTLSFEKEKEAALRRKIAEVREDAESDGEVVEELAGEEIRITVEEKGDRKYQFSRSLRNYLSNGFNGGEIL